MIKPVVYALLLADQVYQDRQSEKFVIAGTFNQVAVQPKPPETPPGEVRPVGLADLFAPGSPCAYVSVTNVRGRVPMELQVVSLADNSLIWYYRVDVEASDPLEIVEFAIRMPRLPEQPGIYALELLAGSEVVASRRVLVTRAPRET